ncbi:MAG: PolC-type DNA polymerase III N-terminal domain-containing protein, partial [Eubacteriales bacterium]|nr:PolC-type DNA polymerase III N-terminal domain-containing protein [Eubacteriales bacterium]
MDNLTPEKKITEVFPNLELTGKLEEFMSFAEVSRVAFDRKRNVLHVWLNSSQWIHKKYIYQLEELIARQLFPGSGIQVKVREHFQLSKQYTPRRMMDVYKTSIHTELKSRDILLGYLFQTADLQFPEEDHLVMTLEDTVFAHEKLEQILFLLDKIFTERCGLPIRIDVEYRAVDEHADLAYGKQQERAMARHIFASAGITG